MPVFFTPASRTVAAFLPAPAALPLTLALLASVGQPAAAADLGGLVKGFCLQAFQAEMEAAARPVLPGMADYACGCVLEQLAGGSSLDGAKDTCRQLTARRYSL